MRAKFNNASRPRHANQPTVARIGTNQPHTSSTTHVRRRVAPDMTTCAIGRSSSKTTAKR